MYSCSSYTELRDQARNDELPDTSVRVFDELLLPIVDARGLNPATLLPVTASYARPGLQPGDVIMMMDTVPVRRTETLAAVAQRLLRRTLARGTWVTVARPIGRIPVSKSPGGRTAFPGNNTAGGLISSGASPIKRPSPSHSATTSSNGVATGVVAPGGPGSRLLGRGALESAMNGLTAAHGHGGVQP